MGLRQKLQAAAAYAVDMERPSDSFLTIDLLFSELGVTIKMLEAHTGSRAAGTVAWADIEQQLGNPLIAKMDEMKAKLDA